MRKILVLSPLLLGLLIHAQDANQSAQSGAQATAACKMAGNPNLKCEPAKREDAVSTHGLLVSKPKVYDDYYLQTLLLTLKNRLTSLNAIDQTTLLGHIGNVQGADLRQMSVAISGSGLPTPGVSTFALAPGVTPFAPVPPGDTTAPGSPSTTTPGTQTTVGSVTPAAPAPPAPLLTMPGNLAVGSLDTLNEQMQLSAEITNLQLLLDGSLSDKLQSKAQPGGVRPKATITLGFPITVQPASPDDEKNRVAEIEVTVCTSKDAAVDPPSIVTLLPQERTYNVAGLVDKSFLGSVSAVLGGLVNVGGGFLWGHKTYYLVQQQEMVALQHPPRNSSEFASCKDSNLHGTLSFSWQIHPVLGQKSLRPGNTQAFVQLSLPAIVPPTTTVAVACVRLGWHHTEDHGNRISEDLEDESAGCFDIPFYPTTPTINSLMVTDIGKGVVSVDVVGTILPGSTVRSGPSLVTPVYSSAGVFNKISFQESAADLIGTGGAFLVARDLTQTQILYPSSETQKLIVDQLHTVPFSGAQSLVSLRFVRPGSDFPLGAPADLSCPSNVGYVVVIGGKVFGLRDNPFRTCTSNAAHPTEVHISFLVPSELLNASPHIEVARLLYPPAVYSGEISASTLDFSVAKSSLLSSDGGLSIAFVGAGLDQALLLYPSLAACQSALERHGATFLIVTIKTPDRACPGIDPKSLKQIVLCKGQASACDPEVQPVAVDIPKTEAPKPSLTKHDPVPPHTTRIEIAGQLLETVVSLQHGKTPLNFRLSLDKKPSLIVDLPPAIADNEGVYTIEITFADKTTDTFSLTVQRPKS